MITPPPTPIFSWFTIQTEPSMPSEAYLLVNPYLARPHSEALGAKRWRLLETLVFNSVQHEDFNNRFVYTGSVEALLSAACGSDTTGGWGRDAIRPLLYSLEQADYFERHRGKALGRSRGSEGSKWVLSTHLFYHTPIISMSNITPAYPADVLSSARVSSVSLDSKTRGYSASLSSADHHDYEMVNHHGKSTTSDSKSLRTALIQVLERWGWTSGITQALDGVGERFVALWIVALLDNPAVQDKGALLRVKIRNGDNPPLYSDDNTVPYLTDNGDIVAKTEEQIRLESVPTVKELLEYLEALPAEQSATIRAQAQADKDADKDSPGLAWRLSVWNKLQKREAS